MAHPAEYQTLHPALRRSRGWVWRALGGTYLRLAGWRIEGQFPPDSKYVLIVAPHTSNWDFTLGLAVMFELEMRVSWLGKHVLFKAPFRRLLCWMGGIPVNRSASFGVVGECVRAFQEAPALMLALSPEGTRKGVSQWKSGFYNIAVQAGVPIMPVGFDYREHKVQLMPPFHPSGDMEVDLPLIQARFDQIHGYNQRPPTGNKA